MSTNFDSKTWAATTGQRVILNECILNESSGPESWKGVGIVKGIEHDSQLSSMNKKNIQMYRILVDFGDGKIASLLPCLLKRAQ